MKINIGLIANNRNEVEEKMYMKLLEDNPSTVYDEIKAKIEDNPGFIDEGSIELDNVAEELDIPEQYNPVLQLTNYKNIKEKEAVLEGLFTVDYEFYDNALAAPAETMIVLNKLFRRMFFPKKIKEVKADLIENDDRRIFLLYIREVVNFLDDPELLVTELASIVDFIFLCLYNAKL